MTEVSASPPESAEDRSDRLLRGAAVVLLLGFLLHNADHLRRGTDAVSSEVLLAGTVSGMLAIVAIALTLRGHRLAPLLATVVGFSMAIGVSVVHLTPHWSAFSDSLPDQGLGTFTWVAVLAEIIGAALFGAAGLYALRQHGTPRRAQAAIS